MFSKFALSASVLLAASQVSAVGNAIVQNACSNDVYLWTVSNTPGEMITVPAGQSYSNAYETNPDGGGVSIKLATEPGQSGSITQFEYTLGTGEWADLWYDISNINGYPFESTGLSLVPSDSSCRSVLCPAGVLCTLAYNQPDDNAATASCGVDADMTLILCSGGSSDAGGSSGSASSSSEASSAAPTTSAYVAPPTSTYVAPASSTSTYVAPSSSSISVVAAPAAQVVTSAAAESITSSTTTISSSTSVYVAPTAAPVVGYVATTFVTQVYTVIATADVVTETPAPAAAADSVDSDDSDDSDWSIFHHPASLGAFWSPTKKDKTEHAHKRAAHRHHFNRHADIEE